MSSHLLMIKLIVAQKTDLDVVQDARIRLLQHNMPMHERSCAIVPYLQLHGLDGAHARLVVCLEQRNQLIGICYVICGLEFHLVALKMHA